MPSKTEPATLQTNIQPNRHTQVFNPLRIRLDSMLSLILWLCGSTTGHTLYHKSVKYSKKKKKQMAKINKRIASFNQTLHRKVRALCSSYRTLRDPEQKQQRAQKLSSRVIKFVLLTVLQSSETQAQDAQHPSSRRAHGREETVSAAALSPPVHKLVAKKTRHA